LNKFIFYCQIVNKFLTAYNGTIFIFSFSEKFSNDSRIPKSNFFLKALISIKKQANTIDKMMKIQTNKDTVLTKIQINALSSNPFQNIIM
jgi:hypothetical protein